jgi:hypothetical protein
VVYVVIYAYIGASVCFALGVAFGIHMQEHK